MEELRFTFRREDGYRSPDDPRIASLKSRLDAWLRDRSEGRESANVSYWFHGDDEVAVGCTVEDARATWEAVRSILQEEELLPDVRGERVEFEEMTRENLSED